MKSPLPYMVLSAVLLSGAASSADSFYKQPNLFNFWHPNETSKSQSIDRFGPVGMSIELRLPPFQMYVGRIEVGGPAEASGRLKTGQKIESINGQVLKDIDPRIQLSRIIADAEASDGKVVFLIKDDEAAPPYEVHLTIPILGAYSETWPLDCPKSDRIVRNMAEWVKTHGGYALDTQGWSSLNGFGMLFLLSTGDESDLAHVRGWVKQVVAQYKDAEKIPLKPWVFGPAAIPLAEYYLRTGDTSVLPVLQKLADHAAGTMYNGGWSGRGGLVFGYMVGGHMNAAGVHVPTFLFLAKACGVDVDERTLQDSLRHFYRFAGKGSLPYGDGFPETYFIDNGKTGALAFTMAAAAALSAKGEQSVYAKARDVSALRGFYGTNYMLTGHTGGGIGEVWRGPAMGFLYEKEPAKYRAFMEGRLWHLEMSRRFDGSFGILNGTGRYDSPSTWGQMMALQYTIPRKTLRLSGAPRSRWSKPYALPERPWGTKADDDFCKIEPAAYSDGRVPEFDDSLEGGTINGIERYYRSMERSDEMVLKHCHHPDHEVRREIGAMYRGPEQDHQILPMLNHADARVRRAGLSVIHQVHKGTRTLPPERLSAEMIERVIEMVNDPEESWWVVENALRAMSLAPVAQTAPHIDRLLYWLQHEEWWLQHASLSVLAPLAVDERYAPRILLEIGKVIVNNRHAPLMGAMGHLTAQLKTASPEVQAAGMAMFSQAYADFPKVLHPPAGEKAADVMTSSMSKYVLPMSLTYIAEHMLRAPGGYSALFDVAKQRHPEQILPYKKKYIWADPATFSPEVRAALEPIFLKQLVPEFVTRNLGALRSEMSKGGAPDSKLGELAGLYGKAGIKDYDWHAFGPDRKAMRWHYLIGDSRTQKGWNVPDFDPAAAAWKRGLAPFGDEGGVLKTTQSGCNNTVCRCGDAMNTLWAKDDLLLWGRFKFPPMKDGHSYRLLIGGASHVGVSGNVQAYINGRPVASSRGGLRRGQGGRPRGALIPPNMFSAFQGQEVVLSAVCQPRTHVKKKVSGNFVSIWIEEMKTPPVTDELALAGLALIPMQSSSWQQAQDSDEAELVSNEGLFVHDGTFVPNESLIGSWTPLGTVSTIEAFRPGAALDPAKPRYRRISFKANGLTDMSTHYWSGDTLFAIGGGKGGPEALKMQTRRIDGGDYLFVETGGFTFYEERSTYKQPRTWQSPWFALKKK